MGYNIVRMFHKKIVPSFLLIIVCGFLGCGYKGDPVYVAPTPQGKLSFVEFVVKSFK